MTTVGGRAAEADFRRIFETGAEPCLVLSPDPAFTILAAGDSYLAAAGVCRDEVLGVGLFEAFPDGPGDLRQSLERVRRERAAEVMAVHGRESRSWRPVNIPVLDEDGVVAMIVHRLEDVTEQQAEASQRAGDLQDAQRRIRSLLEEQERGSRQQRAAEFVRMDERLRDLDRAKADLLADVFHSITVPNGPWARYGLATVIFGAAMMLRLMVLPAEGGLPFVTAYPAIAITVFLCGLGPGLWTAVLGLGVGYFVFMPPFWTIKLAPDQVPVLATFVLFAVAMSLIIDRMVLAAGKIRHVNQLLGTAMAALKDDIVERTRTEQALRDSEEQFRSAFETAAIGTALVTTDGRWIQVNPALCGLLGYTETELLQRAVQDVIHPEDRDRDLNLIRALSKGRRHAFQVESRLLRRSGDIVWVLLSVSLLRDATGAPVHFIAQVQDVTEQKRAEHKSQRLGRIVRMMSEGNQALVQAVDEAQLYQAMCRLVVDSGGYRMAWMGVVDHDEMKTVRPVAHAGHEAGYLSMVRMSWADTALGAGPTGKAVRTGQPQINDDFAANPAMSPWRQPALERGYRSSISLPLKDRSGVFGVLTLYASEPCAFGPDELKLLVELAEDLSYGIAALRTRRDHDALERTLFQAQKMESLGQLTGGIAHDFNNLLQVILSNLDLSLHHLGGGATVAGYLQSAICGAEQGAKLTGQLLAFARRQPLRPEPLRVDRLVGDMTSLLRRTIGETIDIELVTSGGLWTALVDSNQLQNAILNLAINARDAMPQGGKLTIELANASLDAVYAAAHREVKAGQYVMLAITDTGTGMAPDMVDMVFEPFFTTKPEGVGTGLGLSMVYGFVKQSGGHIKIYSEVGLGTTVKLYLPRTQQAEALRVAEAAKATRGNGETILVAEDDDGVRASVVTQLAELGYRVLAAADGAAALDILARGEKVDLLFTDVVMPGAYNGRALADRAQDLAPGLPVVFTSGYTENAIIHHGRLDEGITLLSKPYRLTQLADTVRGALGRPADPATRPAPQPRPEARVDARADAATACLGRILLVDDEELIRSALIECLEQVGYGVVATGRAVEALRILADDPTLQLMITDFGLPDMNGIALIREALAQHPDLAVILATGHYFGTADLPDPAIQVILKPFRPQTLCEAIEAVLARKAGADLPG